MKRNGLTHRDIISAMAKQYPAKSTWTLRDLKIELGSRYTTAWLRMRIAPVIGEPVVLSDSTYVVQRTVMGGRGTPAVYTISCREHTATSQKRAARTKQVAPSPRPSLSADEEALHQRVLDYAAQNADTKQVATATSSATDVRRSLHEATLQLVEVVQRLMALESELP